MDLLDAEICLGDILIKFESVNLYFYLDLFDGSSYNIFWLSVILMKRMSR